jgi:hypothetical protein
VLFNDIAPGAVTANSKAAERLRDRERQHVTTEYADEDHVELAPGPRGGLEVTLPGGLRVTASGTTPRVAVALGSARGASSGVLPLPRVLRTEASGSASTPRDSRPKKSSLKKPLSELSVSAPLLSAAAASEQKAARPGSKKKPSLKKGAQTPVKKIKKAAESASKAPHPSDSRYLKTNMSTDVQRWVR